MLNSAPLRTLDPEIHAIIAAELARQQSHIELIASENFTYPAVLEAQGSQLTNKYAEGYPGKRYYAGNQHSDRLESLAIERARALFGADHANVQPTSGAEANMAAPESSATKSDLLIMCFSLVLNGKGIGSQSDELLPATTPTARPGS